MAMSRLHVQGTPYEQGMQQGTALAAAIDANVRLIERLIGGLPHGEAAYAELVAMNEALIQRVDPDGIDEMRGLADGAGIAYDRIVRLNLPVYMLLERAGTRSGAADECSVFAVGPGASRDARTLLAKTRDQSAARFRLHHVLLERRYPDGRGMIELNGAGIITYPGSGVNTDGVAVGTAGAWSKRNLNVQPDAVRHARVMPDMHQVLRHAKTTAEAVELLRDTPRAANLNIVVADRHGTLGTVEVTPDVVTYTPSENGYACLTNHFVTPDIATRAASRDEKPSSYLRRQRIVDALEASRPAVDEAVIRSILVDHGDEPLSAVCRHPLPSDDMITTVATIADVGARRVDAYDGYPCESMDAAVGSNEVSLSLP